MDIESFNKAKESQAQTELDEKAKAEAEARKFETIKAHQSAFEKALSEYMDFEYHTKPEYLVSVYEAIQSLNRRHDEIASKEKALKELYKLAKRRDIAEGNKISYTYNRKRELLISKVMGRSNSYKFWHILRSNSVPPL